MYLEVEFWIIGCASFQLGKAFLNCSPKWPYQCTLSPAVGKISRFHITNSQHLVLWNLEIVPNLMDSLICISLITREVEHIFFPHIFLLDCLSLIYIRNLYCVTINPLFYRYATTIFTQTVAFLLILCVRYFELPWWLRW